MQRPINVGVVGCGYWGPNLIRNLRSLPDCRVATICDVSNERLSHLTRLYPEVAAVTDFAQIARDQDIDAVAIATPVHTHFELAKQALQMGKHVIVEKPMAASAAQCRELIRIASQRRLTLMVGHTFIYSATVRAIKDIVKSGELGEIFYIGSQRLNLGLIQKDINVVWDLAPHDISIILYLLSQDPVAVNCQGKAHIRAGIEDVTNLSLDFGNGAIALVQSSWLDPNKIRRMTIVGSKRMIVYDDNEPLEKIKIYDKRVEAPPHYDTYAEFHYSYHYGDMRAPYVKQVEPLKVQCDHFLDCIRSGTVPETGGMEGLRVVEILEAASRSLQAGGGRVELDEFSTERAKLSALA